MPTKRDCRKDLRLGPFLACNGIYGGWHSVVRSIPVECVLKRIRNLQRQLIYGLSRLGISILGQNSQHGNIGVVSFNIPGFDPEEPTGFWMQRAFVYGAAFTVRPQLTRR